MDDSEHLIPPDNLESFIEKTNIPLHKSQGFLYNNYFCFCNDIITVQKCKPWIISSSWIVIFLLIDFVMLANCMPLAESNHGEIISTNSLTGLLVQQIGFFAILINTIFLIYQAYLLLTYDPTVGLTTSQASILYYSLSYLPYIGSCISGLIFGRFVLDTLLTSFTFFFLASAVALTFFLLILSRSMFHSIMQFNISKDESFFATYGPVLGSSDLLLLFFVAALAPFRNSSLYQICTVSCIVSGIWGIIKLASNVRLPFIANLGCYLLQRTFFDAVFFSIFGIIWIWKPVRLQIAIELCILILFFNVLSISVYQRFFLYQTKKVFTTSVDRIFNETLIVRPSSALMHLRIGVAYKIEKAVSLEFLKFIIQHRFSEEALADVVRICLARNIPLSEIPYSPSDIRRKYLTRLKFLSMQVNHFKRTQLGDDSPEVSEVVQQLTRETDILETATDNFWTERDRKQRSLIDLGEETKRVTRIFKRAAADFPHSPAIRAMWKNYAEVTLCAADKAQTQIPSPYACIENTLNNPFAFNIEHQYPQENTEYRMKISTTESYIDDIAQSVTRPFRILIFCIVALFVIIFLAVNIYYYVQLNNSTIFMDNYINNLQMPLALSYKLVNESDWRTMLPTSNTLAETLGITTVHATTFRQKLLLTNENIANATQYLKYISLDVMPDDIDGCQPLTLSLLATTSIRSVMITCLTKWYITACDRIEEELDVMIARQQPSSSALYVINIALPTVAAVIIIVGAVFIVFRTRDRYTHLLEIVRQITMVKTQRAESREPDFTLKPLYLATVWVISSGLVFVYAYITLMSAFNIYNQPIELLQQVTAVSKIAQKSFLTMALAEQVMLSEYMEELNQYSSSLANDIIYYTRYISQERSRSVFDSIYPLGAWTIPTRDSFSVLVLDFAHMMSDYNFETTHFRFLMSRYFLKFNISLLATDTLPQMLDAVYTELNNKSSDVWNFSMVFLVLMIICVVVLQKSSQRHQVWLHAVKYLIRREMTVSHTRMQKIIQMIEGESPSIIERVPQPAFIITQNHTIVACNELAARLSGYTVHQMIGQSLDDYFGEFESVKTVQIRGMSMTFKFVTEEFGDGLSIIFVYDISKQARDREKEHAVLNLLKPNFGPVPQKGTLINLTVRVDASNEKLKEIMDAYDEADAAFPSIIRISAGPNHYKGVTKPERANDALGFATMILSKIGTIAAVSVTEGVTIVVGAIEGDTILCVYGEPSIRGREVIIDSENNRCFVDYSVVQRIEGGLDSISGKDQVFVIISPLKQRDNCL